MLTPVGICFFVNVLIDQRFLDNPCHGSGRGVSGPEKPSSCAVRGGGWEWSGELRACQESAIRVVSGWDWGSKATR
jgi:hypothetical protein